jgi:DNA-binding GntR family transcriptional regulator
MLELIDRENHQKLYLQLLEIVRKKVENGEWPIGSQIPTEEELCATFNVSRATVRNAILELVRQGYLKRQQGKGTFVFRNVISEGLNMSTNFRELMFEEIFNVTTNVLARTVMMPIDDLDKILDIAPDKHIIYIKRVRFIDDGPVLLQESFVPYHICPLLLEADIEHNSLFDIFEKHHGIKITKAVNHIDTHLISPDESRLLSISEGSSAICLMQYLYSGETMIMYGRSIKRPDRFKFSLELERKFS